MAYIPKFNPNTTNYDPAGYAEMMDYEERLQIASDIEEERKEEIREELGSDKLIEKASDGFGEFFSSKYRDYADKILNSVVQAIVLEGEYGKISLTEVVSCLPDEAKQMLENYIFDHE